MSICPFCKARQEIDLRQIHFRDLGYQPGMPCPQCDTPLSILEFDLTPPVSIERCRSCHGMFFNPGELECLLDAQTHSVVWLDGEVINQLVSDFDAPRKVIYRKCPVCQERMSHLNFGQRSGVILDRCGTHGFWLEGGKMLRLAEWWRAGGARLHQNRVAEHRKIVREGPKVASAAFMESFSLGFGGYGLDSERIVLEIIASLVAWIID